MRKAVIGVCALVAAFICLTLFGIYASVTAALIIHSRAECCGQSEPTLHRNGDVVTYHGATAVVIESRGGDVVILVAVSLSDLQGRIIGRTGQYLLVPSSSLRPSLTRPPDDVPRHGRIKRIPTQGLN